MPLVAKAQARMLAEGVSEPAPFAAELHDGIRPTLPFDDERIRAALPEGRFDLSDLLITKWWAGHRPRKDV
ncbi:hypothetical protein ACLRGI_02700 [Paenarthrobacter nitroguajacolicus]|uniref:hypothetical protein n=1 Tax=Paenarthrobacter nitroguajacolicus TaxID=211146 RepID=UPI003AE3B2F2